ncbi:histidine kinase N-terminal 7TM domain-containing protein, partial [Planctomycetota bacterium]
METLATVAALSYVHFAAFLVYVFVAMYVLGKSPRAALNRACAGVVLCFATWSFGQVFVHNPHVTREAARLADNLDSAGWIAFAAFFAWFALAFVGKDSILARWSLRAALVVPAAALFGLQATSDAMVRDHVKTYYGWAAVFSISPALFAFIAYYSICVVGGVILVLLYGRGTRGTEQRRLAVIVAVTTLVSVALGSLTDLVLPVFGFHAIPDVSNLLGFLWTGGLVYAVLRYDFMELGPAAAVDKIVSTMGEGLILLDTESGIVMANEAAEGFLGYRRGELDGRTFAAICADEEDEKLPGRIVTQGLLRNEEMSLRTCNGDLVPVMFSGSPLKGRSGVVHSEVAAAPHWRRQR